MGYKKNSSVLFFAAAIALFLFLHFPSQSEAINPTELLSKVCKDGNADCVKILMAHPKSMMVTNLKDIAENALDIARRESIATSDFFTALLNSEDTNLGSKAALEKCAAYFKEAIIFLNLNGLKGDTASLDVHYAYDEAGYCETALAKDKVNIKSVADKIQEWNKIFWIASTAVTAIEESKLKY